MPGWRDIFNPTEIRGLAMYLMETRNNVGYVTSNYDTDFDVPNGIFETSLHDFRLEIIAEDIDPLPFSIEPMPNGDILVTEKTTGVRIIRKGEGRSELIHGTPTAFDDIYRLESRIDIERGMGWLFDIKLHPNYIENGWIYLYHSHRCSNCNEASRQEERPVSMNRLVRGRLDGTEWVDQEIIWQAPLEDYFFAGDVGAGGRITFDNKGHVLFSIGMKCGGQGGGIQNLATPCGKIHRVNDDGSIPEDGPYLVLMMFMKAFTPMVTGARRDLSTILSMANSGEVSMAREEAMKLTGCCLQKIMDGLFIRQDCTMMEVE